MQEFALTELLEAVKSGKIDVASAAAELLGFEDIGFAKVDHHRQKRQGFPEVIFGAGKTSEQIMAITQKMLDHGTSNIMCTRTSPEAMQLLRDKFDATLYDTARIAVVNPSSDPKKGCVLVLSAGTSDLPVAQEAAVTAAVMGANVITVYDVGVSGIHRLFSHLNDMETANVIITVAGMEGALPSVVAGLTDKPIIAVPTSVGYGASFGGLAALLAMLNSCGSGVTVVNIDNGFGAGYSAALINRLCN